MKKTLLWILVIVIVAAVTAGTVIFLTQKGYLSFSDNPASDKKNDSPSYLTYEPMEFTCNLADTNARRYLRVALTLAYENPDLEEEITKRKPQLQDIIVRILRAQTTTSLEEETDAMREEIKKEINRVLNIDVIKEIYITGLIIQ